MHTRRLAIIGCALLLGAALFCGIDLLLGVLFFPIGPEGLSPRDTAIQAFSPWLWSGATIMGLAGMGLLLVVGVRALLRRRQ